MDDMAILSGVAGGTALLTYYFASDYFASGVELFSEIGLVLAAAAFAGTYLVQGVADGR